MVVQQHLSESIEGSPLPFEEAEAVKLTDIAKVRKIYKLNNAVKNKGINGVKRGKSSRDTDEYTGRAYGDSANDEAERKELEIMVLGLMALRGAT